MQYTYSQKEILKNFSEEDIFVAFLNLNDFKKRNIISPFYEDTNPSLSLYFDEDNKPRFKCNGSGKQGDIWQFVADLNNIDCKNEFKKVCEIVANKMNLGLQTSENYTATLAKQGKNTLNNIAKELQTKKEIVATQKEKNELFATKRDFTNLDIEFWQKLGVSKSLLQKFNVYSISEHHFTGQKQKYTKKEAVAFVYELDSQLKLYVPEQTEINVKKLIFPPFSTGIFGLHQLGEDVKDEIIICEGEKDVIVATSRGFNAVTFGSSTKNITKQQIQTLQKHCKQLFVCYDNDEAGKNGVKAIIDKFPDIISLQLPETNGIKGYDITDFFQEHTADDFRELIENAKPDKKAVSAKERNKQLTTIIHVVEDYLKEHYEIRHNIIANEIEISRKDKNEWDSCNENSLWIEMQKKGIKVPGSTIDRILKSDFVPKFNPLVDYFNNLPEWDSKTDYIDQYASYINLDENEDKEQFFYHFKKWCVRSVKCATDDNYFNKNAFVLSDDGKGQNIGKTTWIRNLCPPILSNYIVDNLPKDEKDAKIVLTQNFIVNLDELASLSKQEINTLKSLFSADKIKVRFPYDKKDSVVRRVASFIGSTNQTTFLHDETGSVRWICFVADKIDFSYKDKFDINKLWSQALALSKSKDYDERLSPADIKKNEERNNKFQIQTPEKDLISRWLEIPKTQKEAEFLSATEIQQYLSGFAMSVRLTPGGIGKALRGLGYTNRRNASGSFYAVKKVENI